MSSSIKFIPDTAARILSATKSANFVVEDLWYVEYWSFWPELQIILLTVDRLMKSPAVHRYRPPGSKNFLTHPPPCPACRP
jgi:hypothetical protein